LTLGERRAVPPPELDQAGGRHFCLALFIEPALREFIPAD
jgi:hypothetical protein